MTTTTAAVPGRSLAQRMAALQEANRVRSWRAELKRDLKAGKVRAADVLRDPPEEVLTMKVVELLLAVPKIGRWKVGRILDGSAACRREPVPISPSKTVGGLSERQRRVLVECLSPAMAQRSDSEARS